MIINDETIESIKASLESRGYEVVDLKADDKNVVGNVKTRFGQTLKLRIPTSMFKNTREES